MKVKFNENVSAVSGTYRIGQVTEVSDEFGADMVRAKYAEEMKAEKSAPVVEEMVAAKPEAEPMIAEPKAAKPKGK